MAITLICHRAGLVDRIVKIFCFIALALTTVQAKNIAIALTITLVRPSWRANRVLICDVFVDVFFVIVRSDALENYMFHTDLQLMQVVGLRYGEVAKNCIYFHIPTDTRIPCNIIRWQILNGKYAMQVDVGSFKEYLEDASLEDKNTHNKSKFIRQCFLHKTSSSTMGRQAFAILTLECFQYQ